MSGSKKTGKALTLVKKTIAKQTSSAKKSAKKVSKKPSTYQLYFTAQDKYAKIYGEKAIVFFQLGKFYDAYCTESQGYLYLADLEQLLNIHFIRRDNLDRNHHDYYKPNQFGIPTVSIKKNLTTLVESGYTIILFDQINDGDDIERECAGIYSPGTYISDRQAQDANYNLSVYIVEEKQLLGQKVLMAIGLTLVDITTGTSIVHEFYSNKNDDRFGLDELVRIMQTFRPTETIIYYHPVNLDEYTIKNIRSYLELDKFKNLHFYIYHNKKGNDKLNLLTDEMFKINYQNEYLAKIFEMKTCQLFLNRKQSAIEILGLEKTPYTIISLMISLRYISGHNIVLLRNLTYPSIYIYNKHLILGNNAIEQLNILDAGNLETYGRKIKSLYDVINKTTTPMGKRYLKENLLNPLSQENKAVILNRYEMIGALLNGKLYKEIKEDLKNIYDIERLHRKMGMGVIVPYEFYKLDLYYQSATKIITTLSKIPVLSNMLSETSIKNFLEYQLEYNNEYDFEKVQKYHNFSEIEFSFFKPGIYDKIDSIQENIDYVWTIINATKEYLTGLLTSKGAKKVTKDIVDIESNDRDGYYFTVTKKNETLLKKLIDKKDSIRIESAGKSLNISKKDIKMKLLPKGRTKIFIKPLVEHTVNLSDQKIILTKLIKKVFIKSMLEYYTRYKSMLHTICKFVAEIDFLVSGAAVADLYYYCRPQIMSDQPVPSYLSAVGLRHSIIERLSDETEYVPNDIELGNVPADLVNVPADLGFSSKNKASSADKTTIQPDQIDKSQPDQTVKDKNGLIVFALNGGGKSSLMKSIGIAIILAQIGYYVPATKFVYEPYMALYARITGNDNIFKGLSSFALEMTELDAILLRTGLQGDRTLVIGDEVCRGTEDISGRAIVASALVSLSKYKSSFIFSSHLHDILKLDEIKELDNLRVFNLRVEYDTEKDCLLFNRKLTPGPGPSVYGLTVAKYFVKNAEFISRAEHIKNRLLSESHIDVTAMSSLTTIPVKRSKFNKDIVVRNCLICGYQPIRDTDKELESHHIHFQRDCWADGKIKEKPYLNKNRISNLVVLCRKCHNQVHKSEIIINGYADTSIGPQLDYRIDIKKKTENELFMIGMINKRIKF